MPSRNGDDIQERTLKYAVPAVGFYRHVRSCGDGAGSVLGRQYLRSATSIGANIVEAQSGESRKDFIHKRAIAQKEARESKYWLTLISKAGLVTPARLEPLAKETSEILAILTSIIVRTKKNSAQ